MWVDHVTTLDPRPVAQFGDAAVTTWSNVLYADNFWQNMGDGLFVPNGQSTFGAYNRKLLDLNGGYSSSHSDVHLWYHGTIDLATPTTDTQATITATQRTTWWTNAEAQGAGAGFLYSLIGGGNRLSNLEPAGAGNGKISDGFNRNWDLGSGLAANRSALPTNAGLWPNPIRLLAVDRGMGSFDATLYYQAGVSAAGNISVDLLLDPDQNPYNGNEVEIGQSLLPRTGTNAVAAQTLNATNSMALPGSYNVCLRLTDSGRSRYLYAADKVIIPPATTPPWIDGDSLSRAGGVTRFDVHASVGQTVTVIASSDLATWTALQTQTFAGNVWSFADLNSRALTRRFYRVALASTPQTR
jgi:hypothetical protein